MEKIKEIIAEQLRIDANIIEDNSKIIEDLDADSLDVVELAMAIEEEFDIEISDKEIVDIVTVSDILKFVK